MRHSYQAHVRLDKQTLGV